MKSHRISTDGNTFQLKENENLLEALERTGHQVEFQCRNGFCGACRLKTRSGSVTYPQPPLAFIAHDEILPCCCQVTSDLDLIVSLQPETSSLQQDMFHPDLFDKLINENQ